jgi:hypothetical protein
MSAVMERPAVTEPTREPMEAIANRIAANAQRAMEERPRLSIRQLLHLIRVAYKGHPERKVNL